MADGLERRLVVLMAARIGLAVVSLLTALALEAAGEDFSTAEWWGFYATIAVAFTAAAVYGLALPRVREPRRFAAINLVTDVAIVSALVFFSGGTESVFTFLYVVVAFYAAMLFERRGALASACLCALAYASVLTAADLGWTSSVRIGVAASRPVLLTTWGLHAGAILVVATLGTLLTEELRRTRAALTRQTSDLWRLRSLHRRTVESLMSGLLTTDAEGIVTSFNPEAERISGMAATEAIGASVEEVIPGVDELINASREERGGQRARSRTPYRNRRGEELHLGLAAYILRDADWSPSGHVVIFQDVTDVVEMERDLRRSERLAAVGELSASIAHEIRNPLAAISGSIQMLRRDHDAEASAGKLMDIAIRETDRLNALITDFLHYARPGPLRLETVLLDETVSAVLELYDPVKPDGIEIVTAVEPGLALCADASSLRQVLWNLILNASEAMEEGGRIDISAAPVSGPSPQEPISAGRNGQEQEKKMRWVDITIRDDGAGIDPSVLERIFDPFFTTKQRGSGLGLATVHRVVEAHGGMIHLESRAGEGTAVRVRLPLAEARL